jgi:phage baseplate assembly protein W
VNIPIHSIRYPVAVDAGLGRLAEEPDYARHVEQLMRQVLLVTPGERINRPEFGCHLRSMLFAPNSEVSATLTQVTVFQALQDHLGTLIDVQEVTATAVDATLELRVVYILKARQERRYLNLEVTI